MAEAPVTTSIGQDFAERFAGSLAMYERSRQVIPGGITHDGRHMKPFPPYIANAQGAYKWDVDGNRLIDYVMGHGSLLFGHNDPEILAAMQAQLPRGTHYGAGHELEVRWAEEVSRLVPSAEQVKFTGSGTESTLLAIRVARSFTGRPTVLKLEGHFHGWHDYLLKGERPPFEASSSPGIPPEVMATVAVVPSDDLGMLEERLTQGDIAALILEPSGGSWATIPLLEGYLQAARDLTTMAKIVAGGMPGGAVAGKREIMEVLAFRDEPGWNATKKVRHQGTYNASPVVSAAGITCLQKAADPDVQATCDELAARLRSGCNAAIVERGAPGYAWGESSVFHLALGEPVPNQTGGDMRVPEGVSAEALKESGHGRLNGLLHLGLMLEGVELFHGGGMTSVAHTTDDIDQTVAAFGRVLDRMADEGAFGS